MEIIEKLSIHKYWLDFLEFKEDKINMTKKEKEDLRLFVEDRQYIDVVNSINKGFDFSIPQYIEINKKGTGKKRIVYFFTREENYVLKMISYLLKDYDYLFCDNLYSFRSHRGVKKAVTNNLLRSKYRNLYSYKVDIHNYFNSIDSNKMIMLLKESIPNEPKLINLFEAILTNPYAMCDGNRITPQKGIMAGIATSGFMANLYLSELDRWFYERNIGYIRYSDDIIIYSEDCNEVIIGEKVIHDYLVSSGLTVNPNKISRTSPGENIEFLGFLFTKDGIDVSDVTVQKLKAKMKRRARAIYRWKLRKEAPDERAIRAYIKWLNKKFYRNTDIGEITWCRWYFPLITSDRQLKIIDEFALSQIRYIRTGNFGKKNYNLRYEDIKRMRFKSLVNSYWKFKNNKNKVAT